MGDNLQVTTEAKEDEPSSRRPSDLVTAASFLVEPPPPLNRESSKTWTTCCSGTVSVQFVIFIFQALTGLAVMAWAASQLSRTDTENVNRELMVSLLSTVMGLLFPNPSHTKPPVSRGS
jgi:hypothetical protein